MEQYYEFCDDYMEIIAGTANTTSRAYREAAEHVENDDEKGVKYLEKFIASIEKVAKSPKVRDARISGSKGNLKEFQGHDDIDYMLKFLKGNVKEPIVSELTKLHDTIIKYTSEYSTAYAKNVRLGILEYESAVYLLVTGLVDVMSQCVEVSQKDGKIQIIKHGINRKGLIVRMVNKFVKQITAKGHQEYLKALNDNITTARRERGKPVQESYEGEYTVESTISDTMDLIDTAINSINKIIGSGKYIVQTFKRTVFGIIPMIRGIIYLHYKKKADHIANLEQQCAFIKMNIEQIQRRTDIPVDKKETLVKKQTAVINAYMKKAAKIRAELTEQSRDASAELSKGNGDISKSSDSKSKDSNDEMILENGSLADYFKSLGEEVDDDE